MLKVKAGEMDNVNNRKILEFYNKHYSYDRKEIKNIKSKIYGELYKKLHLTKKHIRRCLVSYQPFVVIER